MNFNTLLRFGGWFGLLNKFSGYHPSLTVTALAEITKWATT